LVQNITVYLRGDDFFVEKQSASIIGMAKNMRF
jgi:hypothetical protein